MEIAKAAEEVVYNWRIFDRTGVYGQVPGAYAKLQASWMEWDVRKDGPAFMEPGSASSGLSDAERAAKPRRWPLVPENMPRVPRGLVDGWVPGELGRTWPTNYGKGMGRSARPV